MRFARQRMLAEREAADVDELRQRDPGEVLPVAVLLITPDGETDARLAPLIEVRCAIGVAAARPLVGGYLDGQW
ncbi:hypothetical protein ACIBG8_49000 [Nonomuraea sp. NPDC050556]|uniref:hypothetical protein n=1 Tax=Nonomuraea sp. NPDC050556 TaxID=3364369 RepID=UPI0037A4D5CF